MTEFKPGNRRIDAILRPWVGHLQGIPQKLIA
jgi:hypothetical protein